MPETLLLKLSSVMMRVLNKIFRYYLGGPRRPVFFDITKTYPDLLLIDQNYMAIREELLSQLPNKNKIPRYHEVAENQRSISEGERDWRTLFVYAYGAGEEMPNKDLCPCTTGVIEKIPNVLNAFFSILDPEKSIPAHEGPYLGYLRYHIGCVVPKVNPPRLRIRDRHYTWQEGKSVLFDDSWNHEVLNDSDGARIVLLVNVMRPMPWLLHLLNRLFFRLIYCKALTRPGFLKMKVGD